MFKILFMGTPDFAMESLKKLYEHKYNIIGVVTNPDKPKGRGMKMIFSPVKEYALEKNLVVYQPDKVKNNKDFLDELRKLDIDMICVVAYGKILPKELLDIPKYGCINVHGSLLPKYRGAAPIQWAILNGDKTTGVTTMYMDEGMDTGDILLKKEIQIDDDETTGQLWDRLKIIGADLLVETIEKIENGTIKRTKQPEDFTMAPMLNKEMSKINWDNSIIEIKNLVRGLNPIMGTYSYLGDKKIKIWKVQNLSFDNFLNEYNIQDTEFKEIKNGTIVLSDYKLGLFIKCKDGILSVLEIQGENAKKMDIKSFLLGNKIEKGSFFI